MGADSGSQFTAESEAQGEGRREWWYREDSGGVGEPGCRAPAGRAVRLSQGLGFYFTSAETSEEKKMKGWWPKRLQTTGRESLCAPVVLAAEQRRAGKQKAEVFLNTRLGSGDFCVGVCLSSYRRVLVRSAASKVTLFL